MSGNCHGCQMVRNDNLWMLLWISHRLQLLLDLTIHPARKRPKLWLKTIHE